MLRGIEDSRGKMRSVFLVSASWVNDPKGPPPRARGGYVKSLVLVGSFVVALIALAVFANHPRILAIGVPCVFVVALVAIWLTRNTGRPAPAYESFTALLANDYCPGCGYGIGDIRPEHDGCTVCPECGAAWRR